MTLPKLIGMNAIEFQKWNDEGDEGIRSLSILYYLYMLNVQSKQIRHDVRENSENVENILKILDKLEIKAKREPVMLSTDKMDALNKLIAGMEKIQLKIGG